MKRRVAVLGGGISGMAAAWYLQHNAKEIETHLFEASDKLGGVIDTHVSEAGLIELGADNFATIVPDALQFCRDMRIENELIAPNPDHRLARIVHRGRVYPIPAGFSLMQPTRIDSILATRVLSWPGKLRILAEYWIKRRESQSDESLQSFTTRRLGREAYERLVEPIVGGIFTANGETLSMQAALPQFVEMEAQYGGLLRAAIAKRSNASSSELAARQASGARYDQFMAPKRGMRWWLDEIQRQLISGGVKLHLGRRATRIDQESNGSWLIEFEDGNSERFDGLLMAINAGPAAGLLRKTCPTISDQLDQIPYASSAVVAMVVQRDEIPKELLCFGLIVPRMEGRSCLAISLTSEKYPGRVHSNQLLLRIFIGGAVQPELLDMDDDQLQRIAWQEVESLLGMRTKPVWQTTIRWPDSMPQYLVGHRQRMAILKDSLTTLPTLRLAGNAFEGVGIPQCVRSGRLAAEHFAGLWSD